MTTREGDAFMFLNFVMPAIAKQAGDSTPDQEAAISAAFSEVAASPYADLVSILTIEPEKP